MGSKSLKAARFRDNLFLRWLPLIVLGIFIVVPVYWAVATSLKTEADIMKTPLEYYPHNPTFSNFVRAWTNAGFSQYFLNSLKISLISVAFIIVMAVMIGYALTRYKFKFKNAFMGLLLVIQFIPAAVMLIPLFNTFNTLGLIGSHAAIIVVNVVFQFPFNSILMRGFVEGVPYSLEEAAQIDGCTRIKAVFKVVIPVLVPGIVTVGAFSFIGCWNEFLFSLMFLNNNSLYTVPIGLKMMQSEFNVNFGALSAGAIIAMTIPVILFAYLQKYLVTGLSSGAVKG